jgi:phosphatidylserine/phosphatidylglycerophosphate/cardiolipin synthase-like enzyme
MLAGAVTGGCSRSVMTAKNKPLVDRPPAGLEDDIAVYFAPDGGANAAVIREIEQAKQTIDVQAFLITSKRIVDALEAARARGVKVRIVLDKSNLGGQYTAVAFFSTSRIPVWRDAHHKGVHDKIMLIDGNTVITGSYNFTDEAEVNAENMLVIRNKPKLFEAYRAHFEEHLRHSDPPANGDGK